MPRVLQTLDLFATEPASVSTVEQRPAQLESQLWIAVHLPALALECLPNAPASVPAVVVEGGKEREIVASTELAFKAGIRIGMRLGTALALAGQLEVFERQPRLEQANLELLAAWAGRLTSRVSAEPPESVLLEISGSLKLFDGLGAIKTLLNTELARRYREFHLGVGPTPTAALWLARARSADVLSWRDAASRLGALPLTVTRWPLTVQSLLRDLGVRTLAECARLPREGFARRVGQQYLHELDRAFGRQPDLRREFSAPSSWSSRVELYTESVDSAVLLTALDELVEGLAALLRRRQAQIGSFGIFYEHRHRPPTLERFALVEPTHERERLFSLVADRLERCALPAPVTALRLTSDEFVPMQLREPSLFEGRPVEELAHALLERLQARFGSAAVYGLRVVAEHRPERAWAKLDRDKERATKSGALALEPRPLWLLPEPLLLSSRTLELCSGPERIESGWWDGHDITRDYYAAKNSRGQSLWVFRDRCSSAWFVHGLFG